MSKNFSETSLTFFASFKSSSVSRYNLVILDKYPALEFFSRRVSKVSLPLPINSGRHDIDYQIFECMFHQVRVPPDDQDASKGKQKTTKADSRKKWSGQSKGTFTSMTASSRLNLQKRLWNLCIS